MKKILLAVFCIVFSMNLYGTEVTRNGVTRRTFTQPANGEINVVRQYKKGNIYVEPVYLGKRFVCCTAWRRGMCGGEIVEHTIQEAKELYTAFEKKFNEPEQHTSLSQKIKKVCCCLCKRD